MVTCHTGTSGTWADGQARAMSLSEDEGTHQDRLKCPEYVQCVLSSSWHTGQDQARLCCLKWELVLVLMVWSGRRHQGWVEGETWDESQAWRQHLDTDNGTLCSCK